jgi:hypothetical protein
MKNSFLLFQRARSVVKRHKVRLLPVSIPESVTRLFALGTGVLTGFGSNITKFAEIVKKCGFGRLLGRQWSACLPWQPCPRRFQICHLPKLLNLGTQCL